MICLSWWWLPTLFFGGILFVYFLLWLISVVWFMRGDWP